MNHSPSSSDTDLIVNYASFLIKSDQDPSESY